MKINEVYSASGGFLKAVDITKPTTVTVERTEVVSKDYNDGKGERSQIVLSFVGKTKKLGLNAGNAIDIAKLTGKDDSDDWVGVTLKLYVKNEKIGNEMKDVIRVWPELPEQVAPEPPDEYTGTVEDETDIPF